MIRGHTLLLDCMKKKVTIALDTDILSFLDSQSQGNRSEYVGILLEQQRRKQLEIELIDALQHDLVNPDYQREIAEWDALAGDGIDAAR